MRCGIDSFKSAVIVMPIIQIWKPMNGMFSRLGNSAQA